MVSQVLQLLRQGVWAALTGGWYHDPEQSKFTNSCHLYLWLFLLLLPLTLHLAFPPNAITVFIYCSSVTIFFTVIKLISYRLHLMFDEGEVIQQRSSLNAERQSKDKEANSENIIHHKSPSNNRQTNNGKVEEVNRNLSTPPLHCSSRGHSINSHHSSGLLELPAQETVEDLKGVILSEDQPVAPLSSTSPCIKTENLPVSTANTSDTMTTAAILMKPVAMETVINNEVRGKEEKVQPPHHHRSEDILVCKEMMKKLPHLSLSQCDVLGTGIAFQPWGSENSVLITEPFSQPKDSKREQLQSRSPQDSLSSSCPQCNTVITKQAEEEPVNSSGQADQSLNEEADCSDSEVAITLVDSSLPGDPLSLHEPIKIVITMSSTPNSMTELESSLHLKVIGTEKMGARPDAHPSVTDVTHPQNNEQIRIPVITFELSEDGGGNVCPEIGEREKTPERLMVDISSNPCSGYESGELDNAAKECNETPNGDSETTLLVASNLTCKMEVDKEGQDSLDPSSCKTAHEKRHTRVLSVDSGTDVLLSKTSTELPSDKEKTLPTSKSDLEAKEGQIPNESNFLEFVSLLESINTSRVMASNPSSVATELIKEKEVIGGMKSRSALFRSKEGKEIIYCLPLHNENLPNSEIGILKPLAI